MVKKEKTSEGIGSVIRSLRILRNISAKDLAEKTNMSASYICDIEANRRRPTIETLEKISEILEVKLSTLMHFYEEGKKVRFDNRNLLLTILQYKANKYDTNEDQEL